MNTQFSTYTINNILPKVAYNALNTNTKTCMMNYRYGFGSHKKDNEVLGSGNYYGFGDYGLDVRLGRRWRPDPLFAQYPSLSPYCFVGNMPIIAIDPDGKRIIISIGVYNERNEIIGYQPQFEYKNGQLYTMNGNLYEGNDEFARKTQQDLNRLSEDDYILKQRINTLITSEQVHVIVDASLHPNINERHNKNYHNEYDVSEGNPSGSYTTYDAVSEYSVTGDKRKPRVALAHELLGHAYDVDQGIMKKGKTKNGIPYSEIDAINIENRARIRSSDDRFRTFYGDKYLGSYLRIVEPKEITNSNE